MVCEGSIKKLGPNQLDYDHLAWWQVKIILERSFIKRSEVIVCQIIRVKIFLRR